MSHCFHQKELALHYVFFVCNHGKECPNHWTVKSCYYIRAEKPISIYKTYSLCATSMFLRMPNIRFNRNTLGCFHLLTITEGYKVYSSSSQKKKRTHYVKNGGVHVNFKLSWPLMTLTFTQFLRLATYSDTRSHCPMTTKPKQGFVSHFCIMHKDEFN